MYLDCLCNKVIDQEACDFLESQMDVEVSPDARPVKYILPDELKDDQRIKAAREKAAFLNFEQRLELVAKKSWRDNVKRRREERKAEEEECLLPSGVDGARMRSLRSRCRPRIGRIG
jgi:hypothetical protein